MLLTVVPVAVSISYAAIIMTESSFSFDDHAQDSLDLHDLLSGQISLLAQPGAQQIQGSHLLLGRHGAIDQALTLEYFGWNEMVSGTLFGVEAEGGLLALLT